ncbi:MAG: S9 family peptidase [Candidatus Limnocylindrales bacterium]
MIRGSGQPDPAPPSSGPTAGSTGGSTPNPTPSGDPLTIEHIVAVEAPREFRIDPRGRSIAFTQESGGARQLYIQAVRGGMAVRITSSEKPISDPRWSPDGRRLAFVRDTAICIVDIDGTRLTTVTDHPAGNTAPHWSPDGGRLACISRRRGWAQVWVVDAPVPRRGRPAAVPRRLEPRPVTAAGLDVEEFEWSPDGTRLVIAGQRGPSVRHASRISIVDVATGDERRIGDGGDWECGAHWLPDGGLLFLTDASGWFDVVRLAPDLEARTVVTAGPPEHGEPGGGFGYAPLPSPDGSRCVHIAVHDGLVDLVVTAVAGSGPLKRGRGRPPKHPRPSGAVGTRIQPWAGVWRAVGWLPDGAWIAAIGESGTRPQDLWLLPVPGAAPEGSRPRPMSTSLPAVLAPAVARFAPEERVAVGARDGLRIEGTLLRPSTASGRRGGRRVPAIVNVHGGPTWQSYRGWGPFRQVLVRDGFAILDVDFRGSTGYGRTFREANMGEWGHADVFDVIDAARWLREQPWCDGRLAIWGGSYGGYLVLSALVEEPSLWAAGIDLYGDSEIAESYRHGDRPGRIDLDRQMGSPDDPGRGDLFRRGSPVYRAERLEAPLLILHGRRDKRVVPLMSERMIEALEIEGKHHEVHWYDDEAHGWQSRENRRDAFTRTREFLRRHVLEGALPTGS